MVSFDVSGGQPFAVLAGHVLRLGSSLVERLDLHLITGIAPDLLLLGMQ